MLLKWDCISVILSYNGRDNSILEDPHLIHLSHHPTEENWPQDTTGTNCSHSHTKMIQLSYHDMKRVSKCPVVGCVHVNTTI